MIIEHLVQFSSQEDDIHADIEPQHQQDQGGQAAVNIGKIGYVVYIEGVDIGKNQPSKSGKGGPRNLLQERQLFVGQDGVDQYKEQKEKGNGKPGAEQDDDTGKISQMRKPGFQKHLDPVSEQKHADREYQDENKADRINNGQKPLDHNISCLLCFNNIV